MIKILQYPLHKLQIMKQNQFLEVMRKHSDDELLEILNVKRQDYVADALAAVEEVLKERGVSYEKKPDTDFIIEDTAITIEKIKASSGKRLLGHIIDVAFIMFVTIMILKFVAIAESTTISNFEINLAYYTFSFLYFFGTETTSNGKTIGKKLLRMSVTNNKGENPSTSTIGLRTLCRFIPFDMLSFLLGGNWHDNISGTYVVSDNELKKFKEQYQ